MSPAPHPGVHAISPQNAAFYHKDNYRYKWVQKNDPGTGEGRISGR